MLCNKEKTLLPHLSCLKVRKTVFLVIGSGIAKLSFKTWFVLIVLFLPAMSVIGQQDTYINESGTQIRRKKNAHSKIVRIEETTGNFRVTRVRIQDGCVLNEWVFNNRLLESLIDTVKVRGGNKCTLEYEAILNQHGEFNGRTKLYYKESGNLQAEIPYVNGKINGQVKSFYPNGKLKRFDVYQAGRLIKPQMFNQSAQPSVYCGELIQPPVLREESSDKQNIRVSNVRHIPLKDVIADVGKKIRVWVTVNEGGEISSAITLSLLESDIGYNTPKVFRKMGKWQPAKKDCESAEYSFIFSVTSGISGSPPNKK
jgi:hypothetical protein